MKKLLIISALFSGTATAEDLVDIMNSALEKDPQLRAAHFSQEASLENRKQAMANFLPQVSGSWSKSESDSKTIYSE